MPYATLRLSVRGPVAEIRLARPDDGNPVDLAFLDELEDAAAAVSDDAAVSIVRLVADGAVFSRGWSGPPPHAGQLPFRCLELLPQPVIASIGGDAVGAGLELPLACDVRIATAGARFTMPAPAPDAVWCGGTQRLPRLIGRARAAELLLLGDAMSAETALSCGLVNELAADRQRLEQRADELARTIASRGPLAVRYTKEAIARGLDMPLEQALRNETDLTVILQTTEDRAEGVRAFLEKRPPRFTGR